MQQQVNVSADKPAELIMLQVSSLVDPPFANARKKRDRKAFNELKASVERNGFASAVTVRPTSEHGKYELIAGFGRRLVAWELGIDLPCIVRDVDDAQAYEIHMTENLERENLSFVDEIYAAKQFVSFYANDRESAAKRLGWSRKKLDERMELLSCDDAVLEALAEGTIKAGHALILAPFEAPIQRSTLTKVIDEKLSVKDLRERARKVQLPITKAKFDTAGCQGCQFNSQQQSGLFDLPEDGALCSKPVCYIEKTQDFLADVVEAQSVTHSKVIFMTASNSHDRVTVSPANVGEEQYNAGCSGCENRASLIDDRPGFEGQVTPSQCLNKSCFNECVSLLQEKSESQQQANPEPTNAAQNRSIDSDVEALPTGDKPPSNASANKVKQKTPERVIETHKQEIREFAGQFVSNSQNVRMAIMAMGVEYLFGTGGNAKHAPTRIKELLTLDDKAIGQVISETLTNGIKNANSIKGGTVPMYEFLSQILACTDGGNDAATANWKPTEKSLNGYYAPAIQGLAKASGVDSVLPTGALTGKKSDMIKAIVEADFDWTSFAPAPYLKLLK